MDLSSGTCPGLVGVPMPTGDKQEPDGQASATKLFDYVANEEDS